MKTLDAMTRDEKSLLLYLETCCVDYGGAYEQRRINDIDREILNHWENEGFITKGRITSSTWPTGEKCWWVNLSVQAWKLAHEERFARFERMNKNRNWNKTEED